MLKFKLAFWITFISILGIVKISLSAETSLNTKVVDEPSINGITETRFTRQQNDEDTKSILQKMFDLLEKRLSKMQEESNQRYDQLNGRISDVNTEVRSRFDNVELAISQIKNSLDNLKTLPKELDLCRPNLLNDITTEDKNYTEFQPMQVEETEFKLQNNSQLILAKGVESPSTTPLVQVDQILGTSSLEIGCKGIIQQGNNGNRVYAIRTFNSKTQSNFIQAYCDMVDDGGGWTIIQRRGVQDIPKAQRENFNRSWTEYENGFGSPNDDHWIGLKHMHTLTKDCENELKVTLAAWNGTQFYAKYSNFQISGKEDDYRLTIGNFTAGTLGYSHNKHMDFNNGMKFTTFDKDNDEWDRNCAVSYGGAWWHNDCSGVSLNGEYAEDGTNGRVEDSYTGIYWDPDWDSYSFKKSEMKIRSKC